MPDQEKDLLELSDEEIMEMMEPPAMEAPESEESSDDDAAETQHVEETSEESNDDDADQDDEEVSGDATDADDEVESEDESDEDDDDDDSEAEGEEEEEENLLDVADDDLDEAAAKAAKSAKTSEDGEADQEDSDAVTDQKDTKKSEAKDDTKATDDDTDKKDQVEDPGSKMTPEQYEAGYKQIMAPFKANGKKIQLDKPEDVIRLMQQGANYTKKLQALTPQLKVLKMLENNDALDPATINHLIDLHKKKPAAIQKLMKDANIDPLDLDVDDSQEYVPEDHSVSSEEMAFGEVVDALAANDLGKGLLMEVNNDWDDQSKDAIWKDPQILTVLAEHKEDGSYQAIVDEIDRQKLLGKLAPTVPFLTAYKTAGEALQSAAASTSAAKSDTPGQETKTPAAKKTKVRKKKGLGNNDRAQAAALTKRSAQAKASDEAFNPLSMSDEEFEKSAELANRI